MPLVVQKCGPEICKTVAIPGKFDPKTGKHGLPIAGEVCKQNCLVEIETIMTLTSPDEIPGFDPNDPRGSCCRPCPAPEPFSDFRDSSWPLRAAAP